MTANLTSSPLTSSRPLEPLAERARTRVFAGRPESVRAARAWVAGFLADSLVADDVVLMTSELVTNAISYTASRLPEGVVTVCVRDANGMVRVDVVDQGQAPPGVTAPPGLGQGLRIVAQLADVFGADGPGPVVLAAHRQCVVTSQPLGPFDTDAPARAAAQRIAAGGRP